MGGSTLGGGHRTWCGGGVEAGQGLPWSGNHGYFGIVGEVRVDGGEVSFGTCKG